MIYSLPALLSHLSVYVWDSPLISFTLVNPASVSQPPAHPRASSLSVQQTSPAPSLSAPPFCASLQLFNPTQKI